MTEFSLVPYRQYLLFLAVKEKTLAATKLQALWRGFMARSKDPSVLKVRQEIRAKRAEEHITHLRDELEKWVIYNKRLHVTVVSDKIILTNKCLYLSVNLFVFIEWQAKKSVRTREKSEGHAAWSSEAHVETSKLQLHNILRLPTIKPLTILK